MSSTSSYGELITRDANRSANGGSNPKNGPTIGRDHRISDLLQLTVPPSRWLDAIVTALPAHTVLSDVRMEVKHAASSTETNSSGLNPVDRDTVRLIDHLRRQSLVIAIRGSTQDDAELSLFIRSLRDNRMFQDIQLQSTEQVTKGSVRNRSFQVRAIVQPHQNHRSIRSTVDRHSSVPSTPIVNTVGASKRSDQNDAALIVQQFTEIGKRTHIDINRMEALPEVKFYSYAAHPVRCICRGKFVSTVEFLANIENGPYVVSFGELRMTRDTSPGASETDPTVECEIHFNAYSRQANFTKIAENASSEVLLPSDN